VGLENSGKTDIPGQLSSTIFNFEFSSCFLRAEFFPSSRPRCHGPGPGSLHVASVCFVSNLFCEKTNELTQTNAFSDLLSQDDFYPKHIALVYATKENDLLVALIPISSSC
jgi:hypothetical protein